MAEKSKLISLIVLLILLGMLFGIICLFCVWTFIVLVFVIIGIPSIAIIAAKWIFRDKDKPSRLFEFFIKTFTLFLIGTSVAYLIGVYPIQAMVEEERLSVFLISLLLEVISIIIYGIIKIKLKPWEIFLSSWYVSMFAIFLFYAAWLITHPSPAPENYYPGYTSFPSPALALLLALPLYSIIPAAICTIVYSKYKKPPIQKPT